MHIIEMMQRLSISAPLPLKDFAGLKARDFTKVINTRPDWEEPAQPASAAEENAAWTAGLADLHVSVISTNIARAAIRRFTDAIDHPPEPVLAYYRIGARSLRSPKPLHRSRGARGPAILLSNRSGPASKRSATWKREATRPSGAID